MEDRNDADRTGSSIDRRSFMALTSLVAGQEAGSRADLFAADGGARSDETSAVHDHSGAGEGGATLRPDDLVTAETPVVDVRAHGVVGDGTTDDAEALQAAVDAATPTGVLFVPAGLRVYFENSIDVDLTGEDAKTNFAFVCEGRLTPAAGIGDAIHIRGGPESRSYSPYVKVRIEGGGEDVETDTAIRVENTSSGLFEGVANEYDGTVYHVTDSAMFSVGRLHTRLCGQSLRIENCGSLGEFRDGWDTGPVRAPEFREVHDLSINQYENYMAPDITERGVLFENCLSVWADKVAVGGQADAPPAEFHDCQQMGINTLHLGGSPTWGAVLDNVRYATFRVYCNFTRKGVKYTGSETDANRVLVNGRNLVEKGLVVTEDVSGGYHYFTGNIAENDAQAIDVRTADAEIYLDNLYAWRNAGGDLRVPEDNEVHLVDSKVDFLDGTPKTVNGVGIASADGDRPDETNWRVGHRVEFTDTRDGSGTGYYERTPRGWREIEDGKPGETDATTTPTERETATETEASGGAAGFGAGAAATAAGIAGVRLLARRGDD